MNQGPAPAGRENPPFRWGHGHHASRERAAARGIPRSCGALPIGRRSVQIHRAYLEAGADFFKTNTFGANRFKLEGSGHTVEEVVTAGVENALQAVEACGHGTGVFGHRPHREASPPPGGAGF